jgi:methyl-accepting chemotaxis protein
MNKILSFGQDDAGRVSARGSEIFFSQTLANAKRTDGIIFFLMVFQWLFAVVLAYFTTPLVWNGSQSSLHPHLMMAIVWGGVCSFIAGIFFYNFRGSLITRHVMAILQMVMGAILIDVTGGRIETHFHVFGSLAILAFYKDISVLLTATLVTAAYHFGGAVWFPVEIYGARSVSLLRALEHAGWVVFEDIFLVMNIVQNLGDIRLNALHQAELEETGDLTRTLQELASAKQNLIVQAQEVVKVVDYVLLAGSSINEFLSQVAANTQQTLTAVTETTTIAEQVCQTVEISSRKARQVAEDAQAVRTVSAQGQMASSQTVEGMGNIRLQMATIGQNMSNLTEKTQQIGEIISAVDDLAQQSNLLSVNAAIEAAKAGEYGRGFFVVAQEVKSLSLESKAATGKVRKILEDVVSATVSAAMSADFGLKAVVSGEEVVEQSREAIVALTRSIDDASTASFQIEASSQQQLAGMQQVVNAMLSVQDASNHSVRSVAELSHAIAEMNTLAVRLKALVEQSANAEAVEVSVPTIATEQSASSMR